MINKYTQTRVTTIEPFQEQITYYYRTSGDSFLPYYVTKARKRQVDKNDRGIPPDILPEIESCFQVTSQYLTIYPRLDDYLVDINNLKWVVLHINSKLNDTVFDIFVRKAV